MVPGGARPPGPRARAPRARGDGPGLVTFLSTGVKCSPRTRGWSHRPVGHLVGPVVLPAHAGMVPRRGSAPGGTRRAPRARGDGPHVCGTGREACRCSPRTRGWSLRHHRGSPRGHVLPAHAGMVPRAGPPGSTGWCAPRARGDGPVGEYGSTFKWKCSPRTRGWSQRPALGRHPVRVLPAHAGMVPSTSTSGSVEMSAPRARGDGPGCRMGPGRPCRCSPRTRGWPLVDGSGGELRSVLPAHAGMVPGTQARAR